MKKLLEENETLMQIVNNAGHLPACPPVRAASPIYKETTFKLETPLNWTFSLGHNRFCLRGSFNE